MLRCRCDSVAPGVHTNTVLRVLLSQLAPQIKNLGVVDGKQVHWIDLPAPSLLPTRTSCVFVAWPGSIVVTFSSLVCVLCLQVVSRADIVEVPVPSLSSSQRPHAVWWRTLQRRSLIIIAASDGRLALVDVVNKTQVRCACRCWRRFACRKLCLCVSHVTE